MSDEEDVPSLSPQTVAAEGRHRPRTPVRLAVVLDEVSVGGAEVLMLNVFRAFNPDHVEPRLICLRKAGTLAAEFRNAGFDVEVLHRTGRFDLRTLPRLVSSFRRNHTDVVLVTHHHRASLALGRLGALLARVGANIVAAHDMDLTSIGKRCLPKWAVATLWMSSALVLLSPRQREYLHREEGVGSRPWSRTREVIIPNGIPLPNMPVASDKEGARRELGLDGDDFVVGIVARLSAQKAHEVLFRAFAILAEAQPHARLVVVGGGDREAELREIVKEAGIEERVLFTGIRRDVGALLPAFDVSCLSSVHEGVPLTVIESMAAGLPRGRH
jgi:glycosyltransferase involved in cell wall biosynthesis